MAKRRFNKYAHRQYMRSRLQGQPKESQDGSNDADASESCEPIVPAEEASDASEPEAVGEASDPLEGVGEASAGEASAVATLRMDFGDWALPRQGPTRVGTSPARPRRDVTVVDECSSELAMRGPLWVYRMDYVIYLAVILEYL